MAYYKRLDLIQEKKKKVKSNNIAKLKHRAPYHYSKTQELFMQFLGN
jgi:hypothetical protein